MRDRQLCAVTLAATSVPALLYLPRLGWVWATAAAAISRAAAWPLRAALRAGRADGGHPGGIRPGGKSRARAPSSSAARCCWEVQRGRCAPSIRRAAASRSRDSCCFWRRPMPQSAERRPSCAAGPSCSSSHGGRGRHSGLLGRAGARGVARAADGTCALCRHDGGAVTMAVLYVRAAGALGRAAGLRQAWDCAQRRPVRRRAASPAWQGEEAFAVYTMAKACPSSA